MKTLIINLSGCPITVYIKHTAKKNIIVRARDNNSLTVNSPKWLPHAELVRWLNNHHADLQRCLNHTPKKRAEPEQLWFRGQLYSRNAAIFRQPENLSDTQQRDYLRQFLFQAATEILLAKLAQHSQKLHLIPKQIALSNAKTFWGVCRHRTGIRLNWRLIGAPDFVQDYVCIHELCHLVHANHSHAFWQLVYQHCDCVDAAKQWLKTHGKELFALG
ncbi:M48 family metallopeptidase [Wielerella bovis]|uniref:M48 family metallopeptidase n=1 Tax=Wielerella bovis TaxID=2917790 RepID=UPI002018FEC3|nr:SprT family zinc-dependent metalloprotease [Wielerella bovis]ULJ66607.1 M48 family metallopeptidase [Wielerella bovis]